MVKTFNYRLGLNKIIGFILAYSFALPAMYAAMSNDITNGVVAYNKGWYSTALYYLTLAEPLYPNNALVHYYRANALARLTRVPEAMTEYAKTVDLAPNSKIGSYAKSALQAACNLNNNVNADQQTSTQDELLQQGNALSSSVMQSAKERKDTRLTYGKQQYNNIQQTEQIEVDRMNNTGFNIDGAWIECYTPDDIAAYKQQEALKEQHVLYSAQYDAKAIASRAGQRSNAIKSSAAALAQQLSDPSSNDGTKLNPLDTNLYVRNYILTPNSGEDLNNQNPLSPPPLSSLSAVKYQ